MDSKNCRTVPEFEIVGLQNARGNIFSFRFPFRAGLEIVGWHNMNWPINFYFHVFHLSSEFSVINYSRGASARGNQWVQSVNIQSVIEIKGLNSMPWSEFNKKFSRVNRFDLATTENCNFGPSWPLKKVSHLFGAAMMVKNYNFLFSLRKNGFYGWICN